MPITYSFDPHTGRVNTAVNGRTTAQEVGDHLRAVAREPWFPAPALVDTRQASPDVSTEEIRAIVKLLTELAAAMNSFPIAVGVPSEVAYGLVRMLGILLEERMVILPFRDVACATEWLATSQRPASDT